MREMTFDKVYGGGIFPSVRREKIKDGKAHQGTEVCSLVELKPIRSRSSAPLANCRFSIPL